MFDTVYIYGLYDPRDDSLRYIGKTIHPKSRLWDHITDAKSRALANGKAQWIRELLKLDLYPELRILEKCTKDNWIEREVQWIADEIAKGTDLFNIAEGGDNPPDWAGRKQTPEHIRKRVEARKKHGTYKHSKETKKKISKNRKGKNLGNTHTKGKPLSKEHKRKLSKALSGKNAPNYGLKMPEETKRKISEAKKGIPLSEKHKKKLSESLKGRKLSPEHVEILRQANLGKQHSEATRRKLSQIVSEAMTDERREEISEMMRQKWQDPEYRRMQQEARKEAYQQPREGHQWTEEEKESARKRLKNKWQDPDYRAKMLAAQKRRRAREAQERIN